MKKNILLLIGLVLCCSTLGLVSCNEEEKHVHTEIIDEAVPAKCTEKGLTEGKHCSTCNEILVSQEEVPSLGHDLVHYEGAEATCTENGWKPYEHCYRCGYRTYKSIEAKGHDVSMDNGNCNRCKTLLYKVNKNTFKSSSSSLSASDSSNTYSLTAIKNINISFNYRVRNQYHQSVTLSISAAGKSLVHTSGDSSSSISISLKTGETLKIHWNGEIYAPSSFAASMSITSFKVS